MKTQEFLMHACFGETFAAKLLQRRRFYDNRRGLEEDQLERIQWIKSYLQEIYVFSENSPDLN